MERRWDRSCLGLERWKRGDTICQLDWRAVERLNPNDSQSDPDPADLGSEDVTTIQRLASNDSRVESLKVDLATRGPARDKVSFILFSQTPMEHSRIHSSCASAP